MSQITLEEVYALARLAKISLTEPQAKQMQQEISQILGFAQQLNAVDVKDLEPTYQVTGLKNVTREDKIIDYGVTPADLLQNAPSQQDGSLKVKRVL
ncbi:MAG TPA: Asp-tRNA(Asn)/Glu-tRNA(Gln) amidotransferase subunit GatC [Candidatus Saccharimonadales bacterium]|nr:Asp-tRNA(Asn)/Glu-tRNA(Gln) amidotransferase subunit GatC [Candidatus Saccharimonadales bacterium]